jgi:hypothetical protein
MNKVIEIGLIENTEKKKKTTDPEYSLEIYKKKIINDLEDVIALKFFNDSNNPNIKSKSEFIEIRNHFVSFYNAYIDINKYLIEESKTNSLMKDILNDMSINVLNRLEQSDVKTKYENEIKEIELLGKIVEKSQKDLIDIEMIS